jgi:hypothetical protein
LIFGLPSEIARLPKRRRQADTAERSVQPVQASRG